MKKITLGGERLGSGKKMEVGITGYGRSNHDLNKIIRTTMAPGTLIPAYTLLCTPGDTIDIKIRAAIQTNSTLGALYGGYIFGVDVFGTPLRIYIGGLQYNAMNLATNMQNMKIPQIEITAKAGIEATNNSQIGSSCVLNYLGIKGIGSISPGFESDYATRQFNAIPIIAYYDIFKNYYSNKQEANCFMIHTIALNNEPTALTLEINGANINEYPTAYSTQVSLEQDGTITFTGNLNIDTIIIQYTEPGAAGNILELPLRYMFNSVSGGTTSPITLTDFNIGNNIAILNYRLVQTLGNYEPKLQAFPLSDLDAIRPVLNSIPVGSTYVIDPTNLYAPWKYLLSRSADGNTSLTNTQEGLMIKTYQSDILQNFIKTSDITAINTQTAVSTAGSTFTIDTLNFAIKLNNLLQREAAAGGTLQEYISVAYGVELYTMTQIPMFLGGYRNDIVFEEVVSTAATTGQDLGYIAGKGRFGNNQKGGNISVKVNEWMYIQAIAHITPKIDYSQGNRWDTHLKSVNDIHKPALDEIGYQDLITEQMAYWDTVIDNSGVTQKSMGKQPAWLNYMTDYNETYGLFAEIDNMMYMTLNRRYEKDEDNDTIKDLTTYIDPVKFNYIFAQTELSAQNFRVQIAFDVEARRKMSARTIPNL